jgi:multicomponent Na+:H+ antiporter subunit A
MEIILAVLLVFVAAVLAPFLHRFLGRRTGWCLALLPAALFVLFLSKFRHFESGEVLRFTYSWVPSLGLDLSFYADGLSYLFILLITGIGAAVLIFGGGYLKGHPLQGRFYGFLLMFMGSMLGLVSADNLLLLFIFWELTSVSSYLLIGFKHEDSEARQSAWRALLITGGGGLALLAGILLMGGITGSYSFSQLLTQAGTIQDHPLYLPVLLLVLGGVVTKSAQVPFHFWLPGAMSAPTPVSAYLHSATMVKAGIFLLARLNPVLGGTAEWHYLVTLMGALTMLIGALMALPQTDLKRFLAYSTVSALGTIVMLLGLSTSLATKAAMVFLLVHSLYKASLFMVAGAVDHETGTRDVLSLGGLARVMPITSVAAGLAALSMSGFPPLLGFISKELLYEAKIQAPDVSPFLLGVGVLANMVNVAVAIKVGIRPFWGRPGKACCDAHEAPFALWIGPMVFAATGLLFGLFPDLATPLLTPAVGAVKAEEVDFALKLWHGINPVFMLSVATVLGGVVLFRLRNHIRRLGEWLRRFSAVNPSRLYDAGLDLLLALARWQTRFFQHGLLRRYILVFVFIFGGLLLYSLLQLQEGSIRWDFSGIHLLDVALAGVILAATLTVTRARSRMTAVVALGVVGYGIALIQVMYSAPDLAITQILVETLTVILFVFLFYRMPRFKNFSTPLRKARDAFIALFCGGVVTLLVLKAVSLQIETPISRYFADESYVSAFGRNVVNVILVDFRALDTLGEILVLSLAAMGVVALLKLKRNGGGSS